MHAYRAQIGSQLCILVKLAESMLQTNCISFPFKADNLFIAKLNFVSSSHEIFLSVCKRFTRLVLNDFDEISNVDTLAQGEDPNCFSSVYVNV